MACSDAIASETCRSDLSNGFVGDLVGEVGSVGNASLDDANGSLCDVRGGAVEGGTEGVRGGPSGWWASVKMPSFGATIRVLRDCDCVPGRGSGGGEGRVGRPSNIAPCREGRVGLNSAPIRSETSKVEHFLATNVTEPRQSTSGQAPRHFL